MWCKVGSGLGQTCRGIPGKNKFNKCKGKPTGSIGVCCKGQPDLGKTFDEFRTSFGRDPDEFLASFGRASAEKTFILPSVSLFDAPA